VAYPAVGEPRVQPNHFAKQMEGMVRGGLLNIVVGCCGTTPAYTEQLAKMASRWRPRKFKNK
jgi:5-methyltetrahydrofolate--homocysteine methyltransferase